MSDFIGCLRDTVKTEQSTTNVNEHVTACEIKVTYELAHSKNLSNVENHLLNIVKNDLQEKLEELNKHLLKFNL